LQILHLGALYLSDFGVQPYMENLSVGAPGRHFSH
jgi:hypothetical protein